MIFIREIWEKHRRHIRLFPTCHWFFPTCHLPPWIPQMPLTTFHLLPLTSHPGTPTEPNGKPPMKAQTLAEKWTGKNFRSKLKDTTLVEFRSICRVWLRSNPNDWVTESTTSSRSNDSNQQHSRQNSLTRKQNSQRSPAPSVSRN